MVETFGITAMAVMVVLALVAVYIIVKFFEGQSGPKDVELAPPEANPVQTLPMEEEFVESFTRPMLEDGADLLDDAVESIKLGCSHYEHGAFVEASDEFHGAIRVLDEAADKFKEVLNDVENQGSEPARRAQRYLGDYKSFKAEAIKMENACDAMIEGNSKEADQLASKIDSLRRMASDWKK